MGWHASMIFIGTVSLPRRAHAKPTPRHHTECPDTAKDPAVVGVSCPATRPLLVSHAQYRANRFYHLLPFDFKTNTTKTRTRPPPTQCSPLPFLRHSPPALPITRALFFMPSNTNTRTTNAHLFLFAPVKEVNSVPVLDHERDPVSPFLVSTAQRRDCGSSII
jgi:hypothetical protein